MELRIGCTGWSYQPWIGTFYPRNLANSSFLKHYSSVFNITEINSTYYRIPNKFMTKKWHTDTSDNFIFTAKFPKTITHENRLKEVKPDVTQFLNSLMPLKSKIAALVLQLPGSLSFTETKPRLNELLNYLPNFYRYPIEGRHQSWFTDEAIDYLSEKNLCLVWNEIEGINNPAPITSDYVYLRLIGDCTIQESEFGKVVRDKEDVIKKWAKRLEHAKKKVSMAFALTNNHLEGFAPASANKLRAMMGLQELSWHDKKQTTMTDFDGKTLQDLYRHSSKLIE